MQAFEAGTERFSASLNLGQRDRSAMFYTDSVIVGLHLGIDRFGLKLDIATDPSIKQIPVIAAEGRFSLEDVRELTPGSTDPSKFKLYLFGWRQAAMEIGGLHINYEFDDMRGLYLTAESEVPIGRALKGTIAGARYVYMRQREGTHVRRI
jgi:hypothetical protein